MLRIQYLSDASIGCAWLKYAGCHASLNFVKIQLRMSTVVTLETYTT